MSTFRDDHDAALARAAALERELERERRKASELADRLEEVKQGGVDGTHPIPRAVDQPLDRESATAYALIIGAVLLVVAVVLVLVLG